MRGFSEFNPIVQFVYFLCAAGIAMFCMNPVVLALSLIGSVLLFLVRNGRRKWASHLVFLALFAVMALINPLFYHNGVTVLFVVNDNPVTLEAVVYGLAAAGMILSVIYWFRSFSQLMTGDRLLYLLGRLSPKLALVLSMSMRYVPLFGAQTVRVNQAQKALGLYKEDNLVDSVRGGARVFSVMVTWALENGIVTADSMTARGYGIGRRSFFALYRFRRSDALFLGLTLTSTVLTVVGIGCGALDFVYYPAIVPGEVSGLSLLAYTAYGLLALLPTVTQLWEGIRWKTLQSEI